MSANPIAKTGGYSYAAVTTLDSDASISVQAGDRVIVKISGHNAGAALPEVSVGLVGGADAGDPQDWSQYNTNVDILTRFYAIEISESRTALVRVTSTLELNVVDMEVFHFRPDAGEVITVVGAEASKAYGTSATIQSGPISASGAAIIIIGGAWNAAGTSLANEQIGGVAAADYERRGRGGAWYRVFTSSQSDIRATATFGDNDTWLADIIAIVSAAPVSGGHTLAYNINGGTHGSAPASGTHEPDAVVTVAARPFYMVRHGYLFTGWNTAANGSGTPVAPGAQLTMPDADVTLYAQWTAYHSVTCPRIIRHGSHDPSILTDAQIQAAAALKVYVEHASVGQDIFGDSDADSSTGIDHNGVADLCGLALLYATNSRYMLSRDHYDSGYSAAWFSTHSGIQDNFRDNPGLALKLSGFLTRAATMGPAVDVLMNKTCFIDASTDPDADSYAIVGGHEDVQEAHEGKVVVLWTMPIESAANTDHNPDSRQIDNAILRQYGYENNLVVMDIADLESDGGTILSSGRECLSDSYTVDGGHLNAAGKTKTGGASWRLLSLIADILGGGVVAELGYTPSVQELTPFINPSYKDDSTLITKLAKKGAVTAEAVVLSLMGANGVPMVTKDAGVTVYYSTDPFLALDSTSRNWTVMSAALPGCPAAIAFVGTGNWEIIVGA